MFGSESGLAFNGLGRPCVAIMADLTLLVFPLSQKATSVWPTVCFRWIPTAVFERHLGGVAGRISVTVAGCRNR
jgi:cobalamin synthase